jgi:hypothetical protein
MPYVSTGRYVTRARPLPLERLARVQDGLVLGRRRDHVVALVAIELDDALDGEVVGLGRTAGEDDVLAFRVQEAAAISRARRQPPSRQSQPKPWLRLRRSRMTSLKYGSIASSTRGSTGVVAWLSM